MCTKYHGHTYYCEQSYDGSSGRHVCTKYHGHTYYCEQSYDGSSGRHVCPKYHGHTLLSTKLRFVTVTLRVLVLLMNM